MTLLNTAQLISELKRKQGQMTLTRFAQELGISTAYLCDIYKRRTPPGPAILGAMGLRAIRTVTTVYTDEGVTTK